MVKIRLVTIMWTKWGDSGRDVTEDIQMTSAWLMHTTAAIVQALNGVNKVGNHNVD